MQKCATKVGLYVLKNLSQVQSQMHIAFLEGQIFPVTIRPKPFYTPPLITDPVKCAKVCDKSWVILKNLSQVQSQMHIAFLEGQLLPVT